MLALLIVLSLVSFVGGHTADKCHLVKLVKEVFLKICSWFFPSAYVYKNGSGLTAIKPGGVKDVQRLDRFPCQRWTWNEDFKVQESTGRFAMSAASGGRVRGCVLWAVGWQRAREAAVWSSAWALVTDGTGDRLPHSCLPSPGLGPAAGVPAPK